MLEIIAILGLPSLLVGTFIEGEVVVVISGLLARLGYFSLIVVILCALVGTYVGDTFFFYIGRRRGQKYLEKRPHLAVRAEKVHTLLHNHHYKILFGFRFLYGLRIATLIALGTTDRESLPTKKFLIINAFNCAIWSLGFVFAGYFFGDFFIQNIKKYEREVLVTFLLIGLIVWIISIIKNRIEYE